MRIGSLFSGAGGLDMGVVEGLRRVGVASEVVWHSEVDAAASRVLAYRWPGVPNVGDITKVDWDAVKPVDILTGGFPCQDVSQAGKRRGLKDGTRSGLWSEYARAIDVLKPGMVVIENVRGLLSAAAGGAMEPDPWGVGDGATRPVINAAGVVFGDLADLGYDTQWCGVRAADAGAPHGRYRIFILAHPSSGGGGVFVDGTGGDETRGGRDGEPDGSSGVFTDADSANVGHERGGDAWVGWGRFANSCEPATDPAGFRPFWWGRQKSGLKTAAIHSAADTDRDGSKRWGATGNMVSASGGSESETDQRERDGNAANNRVNTDIAWEQYEPAIRRWEQVTNTTAPPPTIADGRNNQHRLSARFVEWMMGWPAGWVTDPAIGLSRNAQLKICGNGVVPQQAALAIEHLYTLTGTDKETH